MSLERPLISVIIANYNGARFLGAALDSVCAQTLQAIEIIVVDDASTDESVRIARAHADGDPRVSVLVCPTNVGPAAARNLALAAATGAWVAVFDSDDLMHPRRLEHLLSAAVASGAEIVADDQLVFDDADQVPPSALSAAPGAEWVELDGYIRSNVLYGSAPALGYLKPLISRRFVEAHGLRYDETLRIAEDYDLIARLLACGARFRLVPGMTYFYRRHGASISHRLSRSAILAMQTAHDAFAAAQASATPSLRAALAIRARSLDTALAFDAIIDALKRRRPSDALRIACRTPRAAALLRLPVLARAARLLRRPAAGAPRHDAGPTVVVLSRQRLVGSVNGSSAYLLSLCESLVATGLQVHLVAPSPAVFGRWPVLALQPEMSLFSSIHVRGGIRIGRFIVAADPRVAVRAGLTVLERAARKAGVSLGLPMAPAPYAVAVDWTPADQLFVARHARRHADAIVADYAFLTDGLPYVLRPDAWASVIMHDLFSSRAGQFASGAAGGDSVASLDLVTEMRLLGQADAVVAIQSAEAAIVRTHLPATRVILAPMATAPVPAAQPGQAGRLLFVGSNTAPNVLGLRWFLETIWPTLHATAPEATLTVAGGVCSAIADAPQGVALLGRVGDLAPLYRDAAVVISPLLQGSGLKIKMIEALGHGKAIVATTKTVQGLETLVDGMVPVTDDPASFAAEILAFLSNPILRTARGEAALALVRALFSPATCYAAFTATLGEAARDTAARRDASWADSSGPATRHAAGTAANAERAAA